MKKLLESWTDIECSPAFEAGVWRKIRTSPEPQRRWVDVFYGMLQERLALVTTEAALAGAAAGLIMALVVVPPAQVNELKPFGFMTSTSLSGSLNQPAMEVAR